MTAVSPADGMRGGTMHGSVAGPQGDAADRRRVAAPAPGRLVARSGPVLAGAAVAVVLSEVTVQLLGPGSTGPAATTVAVVRLAAFLAILLAIPGLHAAHGGGGGRFGLAATITSGVGTALLAGDLWFEAFAYPFLMEAEPRLVDVEPSGTFLAGALVSFAAFLAGWALVAVVVLRSGTMPRPAGLLLLVGVAVAFPAPLYTPRLVVWATALAWLGVTMVRGTPPSR